MLFVELSQEVSNKMYMLPSEDTMRDSSIRKNSLDTRIACMVSVWSLTEEQRGIFFIF